MAEPNTAEWYQQQADKYKLKTWTESDRFTKMDRLDLTLSTKLSNLKPLLNQYTTDPASQYSLSSGDKKTISTLRKYAPSLFKTVEPFPKARMDYGLKRIQDEKKVLSAQKTGVQAKLLGLIDSPQYQKLAETGIAPKITSDLNALGRLKATGAFPLQKILSFLNTIPRAEVGMLRASIEATKKYKEENKGVSGLLNVPLTEQIKATPEILSETFKSAFNTPGAKSNEYFAELYKDYLPEKFSKGFEWTKDQDDWGQWLKDKKGLGFFRGNWVQKLGSAIAGSPADILGLATDVLLDPTTYFTGGLAKGARLANISYNVVAKGGRKVIPKGATIVLKKAGLKAVEKATPRLLKIVRIANAKAIKTFKSPAMLDDFLNKKVINLFLKESKGKFTAGQLANMFDTGGAKIFGQTVVPGFKLQKVFGKSLDEIAKMKAFKGIVKAFNPQAGIDEVFRPLKAYGESLTRAIYGKNLGKFMRIIGRLSKEELTDLNMLKIIDSNIPLLERKLTTSQNFLKVTTRKARDQLFAVPDPKNVTKSTKSINDIARKMAELQELRDGIKITPKLQTAADELGELLGEVRVQETGLGYKQAEDYFPAVFQETGKPRTTLKSIREGFNLTQIEDDAATKWADTSVEKAFFEKAKTRDVLEAMKEGLAPVPIEDVIPYRLRAGAKRLARVELTDGVKQFGVQGKFKAGKDFIQLRDAKGKVMKELKGWYFPKELENSFSKVGKLFFGDESARNAFKYYDKLLTIWKRWALATPGYHFRNFYSDTFSGVMEYGLDYLNPKHWADYFKFKKTGSIKIRGKIYTADDFVRAGIDPGQYVAEAKVKAGTPQNIRSLISLPEQSLRFGQHREAVGRGVAGIIELKKGSSIIDAAFNVKKVFFDYQSLTPFEQGVMKRFIPFYTWLRKNVQRQVELVATRTGGYASIPKFLNYLEETAETMYGHDALEQYKETQPEYYKGLGVTFTAMKDKEGNPLAWNPNLPFQDWSRLSGRDIMSSASPILKIVMEMVTNRDIFFESTIDRAREGRYNYSEAPKWLSATVGKLPESVLKQIGFKDDGGKLMISDQAAYNIRQIPMLASLSRTMPAVETPKTGLSVLSTTLGAKFFQFDPEREKAARAEEFSDKVTSLKKPGGLGVDDIETAYKQMYSNHLLKQFPKYSAAQAIREKIKYAGGSNAKIRLLLDLMEKPYNDAMDEIKGKTLPELATVLSGLGITPTMKEVESIINQLRVQ